MKSRDQFNFDCGSECELAITSSKFKSVCHTDPANLSLSLIMSLCHQKHFVANQFQQHRVASKKELLWRSTRVGYIMMFLVSIRLVY